MYAAKFGVDRDKMMQRLWGDNFFDPATKMWTTKVLPLSCALPLAAPAMLARRILSGVPAVKHAPTHALRLPCSACACLRTVRPRFLQRRRRCPVCNLRCQTSVTQARLRGSFERCTSIDKQKQMRAWNAVFCSCAGDAC